MSTKLIWNGDEVEKLIEQAVHKGIFEAGVKTMNQAAALAPKDTGRLRGSITLQMKNKEKTNSQTPNALLEDILKKPLEENVGLVGNNMKYGVYQEYGTEKMKARPYMRPAFDIMQGKTEEIFRKLFKREIKEYLK